MPILPMSCSSPPRCRMSIFSDVRPNALPIFNDKDVTLSECPAVQGDFASTVLAI